MDNRRRVLIVAYDGAQILDIACPSGALDIANRYGAAPPYSIELGTLGRQAAHSSSGIVVGAGQGLEAVTGRLDTLIVVGGIGCEDAAADEHLLTRYPCSSRLHRPKTGWCETWRAISRATWPRTSALRPWRLGQASAPGI
jgi:transcriptional regulator GlxA family with amidase domain